MRTEVTARLASLEVALAAMMTVTDNLLPERPRPGSGGDKGS